MADINKTVNIEAQVSGFENAKTQIDSVTDSQKKLTSATKAGSTTVSELGKVFKKAFAAFSVVAIAEKIISKFTEILLKNKVVADALATVMTTVEIVISKLIQSVVNTITAVSKATGGFDALGKVVKGVVTLSFTPFLFTVNSIKLAILGAQLAWEDSFLGGKDQEKITQLNKSIGETTTTLEKITENAKKAGTDIKDNIVEAIGETAQLGGGLITGLTDTINEIDLSKIYGDAKNLTDLRNNFELSIKQQERLVQQFENQKEVLEDIAADDTKSIQERIKASQDLEKAIINTNNAQKAVVEQRIAQAKQEIALLGENDERAAKLFDLQTQLLALDTQKNKELKGQQATIRSLKAEEQDLSQLQIDGTNERNRIEKEFQLERETDLSKRLTLQQELLDGERSALEADIARKRELYAEGTQARIEAEQAYLLAKQELDNQELLLEDDKEARRKEILGLNEDTADLSPADRLRLEKEKELSVLQEAFDSELISFEEYLKRKADLEDEYNEKVKQAEFQSNIERAEDRIAKAQMALDTISSFTTSLFELTNNLGEKEGKNAEKRARRQFAITKALNAAQAGINIAGGIAKSIETLGPPVPPNIPGIVGVATAGAIGAAQLASILSAKFESPKVPDESGDDDTNTNLNASPNPALFDAGEAKNVTSVQSGFNQQGGTQTIKAVVVESDITATQDRLALINQGSEL